MNFDLPCENDHRGAWIGQLTVTNAGNSRWSPPRLVIHCSAIRCWVGSSPLCTLSIAHPEVDWVECLISLSPNGLIARNFSGQVRHNGKPFGLVGLSPGDTLEVGPAQLRVIAISLPVPEIPRHQAHSGQAGERPSDQSALDPENERAGFAFSTSVVPPLIDREAHLVTTASLACGIPLGLTWHFEYTASCATSEGVMAGSMGGFDSMPLGGIDRAEEPSSAGAIAVGFSRTDQQELTTRLRNRLDLSQDGQTIWGKQGLQAAAPVAGKIYGAADATLSPPETPTVPCAGEPRVLEDVWKALTAELYELRQTLNRLNRRPARKIRKKRKLTGDSPTSEESPQAGGSSTYSAVGRSSFLQPPVPADARKSLPADTQRSETLPSEGAIPRHGLYEPLEPVPGPESDWAGEVNRGSSAEPPNQSLSEPSSPLGWGRDTARASCGVYTDKEERVSIGSARGGDNLREDNFADTNELEASAGEQLRQVHEPGTGILHSEGGITSPAPKSPSWEEDQGEGEIQNYLNRLLERLRADGRAGNPCTEPRVDSGGTSGWSSQRSGSSVGNRLRTAMVQLAARSVGLSHRREGEGPVPNEFSEDVDSFRRLASQSAKSALVAYQRRRLKRQARSKLGIAMFALLLGLVSLWVAHLAPTPGPAILATWAAGGTAAAMLLVSVVLWVKAALLGFALRHWEEHPRPNIVHPSDRT